ncbi:MAG: hypothetical protein CFE43_18185 [Burkholderiales bacterium PBB3]|nr:MAG: hypothetical protein CFE43_18185 [Burkholderiales bacterium PBB3]
MPRPAISILQVSTLLLCAIPQAWAQSDAEVSNQYYRYSNPQLEAACARMSPNSHASGLTDGAFVAVPFAGRTYYYQSDCYLELARRTADVAWCAKVRERKTLLGDGSSHTPASCQRMVAVLQESRARIQQSADRHAAAVQGVFKIESAHTTVLPTGDWLLLVKTTGSLPGRYRLQVDNSRDRIRLVTQELMLPQPAPLRYTLARKQVLGSSALPNIFPIAVSLTYVFPADSVYASQEQVKEHLSSIQNLTLSAQWSPAASLDGCMPNRPFRPWIVREKLLFW